jgi:hypothetical protein
MPKSCKDRCTTARIPVPPDQIGPLLLTAKRHEPAEYGRRNLPDRCGTDRGARIIVTPESAANIQSAVRSAALATALRLTLATSPFPEAHFATFPPALVEPCILAGTSARGVCPNCAAPWERIVKKSGGTIGKGGWHKHEDDLGRGQRAAPLADYKVETIGWRPTCSCNSGGKYADPIPATVLDPFLGAGTTALVAARLGRDWIGIELSPAYAEIARRRLGLVPQLQKAA